MNDLEKLIFELGPTEEELAAQVDRLLQLDFALEYLVDSADNDDDHIDTPRSVYGIVWQAKCTASFECAKIPYWEDNMMIVDVSEHACVESQNPFGSVNIIENSSGYESAADIWVIAPLAFSTLLELASKHPEPDVPPVDPFAVLSVWIEILEEDGPRAERLIDSLLTSKTRNILRAEFRLL